MLIYREDEEVLGIKGLSVRVITQAAEEPDKVVSSYFDRQDSLFTKLLAQANTSSKLAALRIYITVNKHARALVLPDTGADMGPSLMATLGLEEKDPRKTKVMTNGFDKALRWTSWAWWTSLSGWRRSLRSSRCLCAHMSSPWTSYCHGGPARH